MWIIDPTSSPWYFYGFKFFLTNVINLSTILIVYAGVAKLVDARDSKSRGATHVGSSPTTGTKISLTLNFE